MEKIELTRIKHREPAMKQNKKMLRLRFYAETNVELRSKADDWKSYAEWHEKLSAKKVNNEILQSNDLLRSKLRQAMDILEEGITKT
jgi:2-phospho-L-lactate transferase/gluconeogenesis factor (CofD/UPF0052 family)